MLSAQQVNDCLESTCDEMKTHRHNRLIFTHHL
jgi:hypothetical protein